MLAALLCGCSVDEISVSSPPPVATPSPTPPSTGFEPALPRLASGPHLGMITGFDPLNAERAEQAALRYQQARASGASVGRVQIDWSELETAPGEFDEQALVDAFEDPGLEGMNLVVLVSTLDTEGLTIPAYLMEGDGLRDGLTLGSPEVVNAFTVFLDWLGPQLMAREVWLLSIANEPIGPIEDGLATEDGAVTFYSTAMDRWNEAVPEIGVTATFTLAAPSGIPLFFEAVRSRADIVSLNFYCLTADIQVTGQSEWEARLAQMKADAGDRDIFIQELGCPVGYSPQARDTFIGGSLENQVAFFEFFGEAFATDPQLRAATMFQLYDWSPELAAMFGDLLRDQGVQVAGDRLEEWLATSGFLRWEDSFERPAWQTWLSQLERVREAREE
ncbi:MAG: hypothetical protein AAFQ34_10550 [Pseudomonadota bacterium]